MTYLSQAFTACAVAGIMVSGMTPGAEAQDSVPRAGVYELEPNHAALIMRVDHLGFSDIVVRFDRFSSTLTLDPDAPDQSSMTARIAAASISSGIASFDAFLRGPNLLNAEAHPDIRFTSQTVEVTGPESARVTGDLVMRGQSHPVVLDVRLNGAGVSPFEGTFIAGFSATGTLSRAQWGLDAFSPAVGDDVRFAIEAEFRHTGGN